MKNVDAFQRSREWLCLVDIAGLDLGEACIDLIAYRLVLVGPAIGLEPVPERFPEPQCIGTVAIYLLAWDAMRFEDLQVGNA